MIGVESKGGRGCSRCETLPAKIEDQGRLYAWFPLGHSFGKVAGLMGRTGAEFHPLEDGQCMLIRQDGARFQELASGLGEHLTSEELNDIQVLHLTEDREPDFRDFGKVTSLRQFITVAQSGWLIDMLAEERVTCCFQPIVHVADTSRIFAQEALFRGVDTQGSFVPPGKIFDLSRDAGMMFQVDLLARRTAIREAVRHRLRNRLFINFNPTSIYDPAFCLRSTVSAVDDGGIPHEDVVFEVTESDRTQDLYHLKGILNFYREAGFRIALDDLGSGYSSLNLIHQLRPDYIKLDVDLIRDVHLDPYKAAIAAKLLEIAQSLNVETVVEGIEHLEELRWAREHGATYAQGYLIARPCTPPAAATPALGVPEARMAGASV